MFEKLVLVQLVGEFTAFYESRKFFSWSHGPALNRLLILQATKVAQSLNLKSALKRMFHLKRKPNYYA
jgi:hypothetical protein